MRHLAALASVPRDHGSAGLIRARAHVRSELAALGFRLREECFEFSAFPGALGAPAAGLVAATIIILASALGAAGHPVAGLAALAMGGILLGLAGRWLAREGVLRLPWMRRDGVNLFATRGVAVPRVWLVAHLDAKWQPVPTAVRTLGVLVLVGAAAAAALLLIADLLQVARAGYVGVMMLAGAGAIPLGLSFVGRGGHGALDNASGVATVLEAAQLIGDEPAVGVAITDAEELALAGARAWARGHPRAIALNVDGVDDIGRMTLMTVATSDRLVPPFRAAAADLRVIRLIPGVLTDSVAFADAGWETVTLSRGSWRTLGRIHTTRDRLDHLEGTGIGPASQLLATAALEVARWKS